MPSTTLDTVNKLAQQPGLATAAAQAGSVKLQGENERIDNVAALGARVRAAREAMNKSQQELAALSGVGRRFISELENGKPTLEVGKIFAVLKACGIDLVAKTR